MKAEPKPRVLSRIRRRKVARANYIDAVRRTFALGRGDITEEVKKAAGNSAIADGYRALLRVRALYGRRYLSIVSACAARARS